ncbi:TPA: TIGR03757 family integrating conjugative element protein [Pseudomonas aeruginosa]|uniref:TIGR03757 family integrating conjugative element protein n=1 Tax=Pseudomonas aeruginosa TaxID=287 RepID=UPI00070EBB1E|nr:TIGR03757 family integrating conjugative element protein [Pseudomonas aeruginosa]EKV3033161.1 TIGR03757 family integrating conjugative element protein [Pseudomonas aeruginosa]EKV3075341.1 TIGR03757 family integrating conjugative element protein [Pseudomonas aeruginosa]MCO3840224.1 TIGR03757 family integrating conjugative element protein [Pseudomonas aeruginosa]MCT4978717.1 TIGR03757 family integrating conjugative element protein [Pseudomonas aeruginosa]NPW39400.1 TIGR03757 family integratin
MQRTPLAIAALLAAIAWPAVAEEVRVFTHYAHPVHNVPPKATVTELDAGERLEAELSVGLPDDAARAASLMQQRLEKGGHALQRRLAAAYQGVADAWSMGVTKLPAVVVDRRYVIYGEPDVAAALTRIARFRESRP